MVNGKRIRLIMNVRDDVEKLTKSGCLKSVRPVIDSWYIKDTGSLDQTKDFIAKQLKGIPGHFGLDEVWVGHAHNRTLLLEEAEQVTPEADYNLMMDSDMELVIVEGIGEPELLVDSYLIDLHDRHMIYPLPLLTNARMKFIYHGVAHAYLNAVDPAAKAGRIRGFWHLVDHGEGQPREGKIERDMMLLRQAVVENPNDHRSWFYLAQSYRDLEMWPEAVQAYKFRASLGGWEEEVYYSLLSAGIILSRKFSILEGMQVLLDAWRYRPIRSEALRALSAVANVVSEQIPFPENDVLFIDSSAYRKPESNPPAPVLPLFTGGRADTAQITADTGEGSKTTFKDISAILVTRGNVDLAPIVNSLPYEDIIVWDNSDETLPDYKVFGRYAALKLAKHSVVYWQDDDIIFTEHQALLDAYNRFNEHGGQYLISNMDQPWIEGAGYGDFLGMVGAGSLCPADLPDRIFAEYFDKFPFDEDMLYEPDFAFGVLAPFKRVDLGYAVRDFADAPDRLYQQSWQHQRKWKIINRCREILAKQASVTV